MKEIDKLVKNKQIKKQDALNSLIQKMFYFLKIELTNKKFTLN